MNCVWIPGWQFSPSVFDGIQRLLPNTYSHHVLRYDQTQDDALTWLQHCSVKLPKNPVLVGWSLGGMLAYHLACLQGDVDRVFILNANTHFAGDQALPLAQATQFQQRYCRQPVHMRRKFLTLVDSQQTQLMQPYLLQTSQHHSLQWLMTLTLDTFAIQGALPSPNNVHVLLAQEDALVPVNAAKRNWATRAASVSEVAGAHSLPLTQAQRVANWIQTYE